HDGEIVIKGDKAPDRVDVFDSTGRKIISQARTATNIKLPHKGIFLVNISYPGGLATVRVLN
ncbi:hypothetical protein JZU68_02330, partial [bacterium]|nr:hypothetical protein [bacterium]